MPKRKPKARPGRQSKIEPPPILWSGSEDLRPLLVPIHSLLPDPRNARTHGPVNSERIGKSLKQFGQQKPVVVDDKGIITAGNGTWQEAIKLGWTHVARVRTQLTGAHVTAYGLADNVTSDSAGWDPDQFHANIDQIQDADLKLEELGLDLIKEELDEMFEGLTDAIHAAPAQNPEDKPAEKPSRARSAGNQADSYNVIVYLPDEATQASFLEEMETRQLKHKAL